jgi:hypothetical protein
MGETPRRGDFRGTSTIVAGGKPLKPALRRAGPPPIEPSTGPSENTLASASEP